MATSSKDEEPAPQAPQAPERKKYSFNKASAIWRQFEQLFLELPAESYPLLIRCSKGQAINQAMLLNRAHVQWAREQGVPDEGMLLSAKAKRLSDLPPGHQDLILRQPRAIGEQEGDVWALEISEAGFRLRATRRTAVQEERAENLSRALAIQGIVLPPAGTSPAVGMRLEPKHSTVDEHQDDAFLAVLKGQQP